MSVGIEEGTYQGKILGSLYLLKVRPDQVDGMVGLTSCLLEEWCGRYELHVRDCHPWIGGAGRALLQADLKPTSPGNMHKSRVEVMRSASLMQHVVHPGRADTQVHVP